MNPLILRAGVALLSLGCGWVGYRGPERDGGVEADMDQVGDPDEAHDTDPDHETTDTEPDQEVADTEYDIETADVDRDEEVADIEEEGDGDAERDVEEDADVPPPDYCLNAPMPFSLTAPADGAGDQSLQPLFSWDRSLDGDVELVGDEVTYTLVISLNEDMSDPVYTYEGLTTNRFNMVDTEDMLSPDETYYYQIIARDRCATRTDEELTRSAVYIFSTISYCETPPDDTGFGFTGDLVRYDVSLRPEVSWAPAADVDPGDRITYRLECNTTDSFPPLDPSLVFSGIEGTSFIIPGLLPDSTYYCRVVAVDGCRNEVEAAEHIELHTIRACSTAPGMPVLEGPEGSDQPLSPLFSWSAVTDPDAGDSVNYHLVVMREDGTVVFDSDDRHIDITDNSFDMFGEFALTPETNYRWYVEARDGCGNVVRSDEMTFRTLAGACVAAPSSFALTGPSGADISVTPTFTWEAATDTPGDRVTYTLTIHNSTGAVVFTRRGIGTNSFSLPAASALASNSDFTWTVDAEDGCGHITHGSGGAALSFRTERVCVDEMYTDDTFGDGTTTNVVVIPGTGVVLPEDSSAWTYSYNADVLPTADGWTMTTNLPEPLSPWTAPTPEISPPGILHLNSIDNEGSAYFSRDPGFSNATGWVVEARMQVIDNTQSNPSGSGCAIYIEDGVRYFFLRLLNERILDFRSSMEWPLDTRDTYHTYRITGRNDDFAVYVDGILRMDGTDRLTLASGHFLRFNDMTDAADSESRWDYIRYYNGGTAIPFVSEGRYLSGRIDTGSEFNNIGSGATISWGEDLPAGTDITLDIYASDATTLPGIPCATSLSNNIGEIIPDTCSGRYIWWAADLDAPTPPNATPILQRLAIDYQACE